MRSTYFAQKLEKGSFFKDRDRWVIKILGAERGCWISGCCLLMWVFIHRYRGLLKRFLNLKDDLREKNLLIQQQRELILSLQSQLQTTKPLEATSAVDNTSAVDVKKTATTVGPTVNNVPVHNFAAT